MAVARVMRPPVPATLPSDRVAVGVDVRERKAEIGHVRDLLAAGIGEVAAAELPRAFEQMADRGAARETVDVVRGPAVLVHRAARRTATDRRRDR